MWEIHKGQTAADLSGSRATTHGLQLPYSRVKPSVEAIAQFLPKAKINRAISEILEDFMLTCAEHLQPDMSL